VHACNVFEADSGSLDLHLTRSHPSNGKQLHRLGHILGSIAIRSQQPNLRRRALWLQCSKQTPVPGRTFTKICLLSSVRTDTQSLAIGGRSAKDFFSLQECILSTPFVEQKSR